jgi:hypothetical protein
MPAIEWRKDCWGEEGRACYYGNLYVGQIMHSTKWAERTESGEWRGWFMSSDEGDATGIFPTEAEAKQSVEAALAKALAI